MVATELLWHTVVLIEHTAFMDSMPASSTGGKKVTARLQPKSKTACPPNKFDSAQHSAQQRTDDINGKSLTH